MSRLAQRRVANSCTGPHEHEVAKRFEAWLGRGRIPLVARISASGEPDALPRPGGVGYLGVASTCVQEMTMSPFASWHVPHQSR